MVDVTPPKPTRENEFSRSPARTNPSYAELMVPLNTATKINEVGDIRAAFRKAAVPLPETG